jgi:hypothetical protein
VGHWRSVWRNDPTLHRPGRRLIRLFAVASAHTSATAITCAMTFRSRRSA